MNTSKKTLLIFLLSDFADWEAAYVSSLFNDEQDPDNEYQVRTLGVSSAPVRSMGGLTVTPDYVIDRVPYEYAGLVLIGGTGWRKSNAEKILPLVNRTLTNGKVLAAICDATCFLGKNGFLNSVKHTSNGLEGLVEYASPEYTNAEGYINEPAVEDGNIVTANGTSPLEFARLLGLKMGRDEEPNIQMWYGFNKLGEIEMLKRRAQQDQ